MQYKLSATNSSQRLVSSIDNGMIKIITGPRRCWKSYDDDGVTRLGLFDFLKDKNSLAY